ncbi:sialidase family protein [Luteimonas abyssi]|uniref:sialidase family protein n=1 Tax=Luteimonas abyssi TaxID=1247514 RepID=UPI000737C5A6|nr:sialidase family protein [Luteimonas abyssi]
MRARSLPAAAALMTLALLAACSRGAPDLQPVDAAALEAPTRIEPWLLPAAEGTQSPDLALGPDGRVMLSWIDSQPGRRHQFRFSNWWPGDARWDVAPKTIALGNRMFVNWADTPHILAMPDGAVWAHWLQRNGNAPYAYDVALARSRDGGANWTAPVVVHDDGTQTEHGFVAMWPQTDNLLGIAWLDGRATAGDGDPAARGDHAGHDAGHGAGAPPAGAMSLRAALIDGGLQPVLESTLDTRVCDCCQTDVAITAKGPLVVYRGRSMDEVRDILVARLDGNVWTAPRRVHADDWVMPACPVNGPSIAADGEGVVVAWYTAPDGTPQVRLARSDDSGDRFGEPVVLDRGAEVQGRVAVALDAQQARVIWLREADGEQTLMLARYTADLSRELERTEIATLQGTGRGTGFPKMVVSAGIAHVVWTDVVDGRPQLRGARLGAGD